MMGKTHITLGAACTLWSLQPETSSDIALVLIGASIGCIFSDIDIDLSFDNYYKSQFSLESLLCYISPFLFTTIVLLLDIFLYNSSLISQFNNTLMSIVGIILYIGLAIYGLYEKKHRGKTHSLLAMVCVSGAMTLINLKIGLACLIGFGTHLISDLFNKKGMELLWPFTKKRICLHCCTANGIINNVLFFLSLIASYLYFIIVLL